MEKYEESGVVLEIRDSKLQEFGRSKLEIKCKKKYSYVCPLRIIKLIYLAAG